MGNGGDGGNKAGNGNGKGNGAPPASAGIWYLVGAYVVVGIAIFFAIQLAKDNEVTIGVSEGFAPFAVIYIVAQAIERFLQPISGFAVKATEKKKTKVEIGAAKSKGDDEKALKEQTKLQVIQADRAVIFWAAATVIALLVCGKLELGLIGSIANVTGENGGDAPTWFSHWDVVITGIAIGAGTKPLHDLITAIQNAKQKSDPVAG